MMNMKNGKENMEFLMIDFQIRGKSAKADCHIIFYSFIDLGAGFEKKEAVCNRQPLCFAIHIYSLKNICNSFISLGLYGVRSAIFSTRILYCGWGETPPCTNPLWSKNPGASVL